MLSREPSYIGTIVSVSGATASVRLARSVASGLSIIHGNTYRIGQVGSFVRVPQGYQDLFGIVSEVGAEVVPEHVDPLEDTGRWMRIEMVGETVGGSFERGISQYPNIGDAVHLAVESDLHRVYGIEKLGQITIGSLSSAESIPAKLGLNEIVTRHTAVVGSTGSGKSTTVASLIRAITDFGTEHTEYPSARILLLDVHGEYADPLKDVADVFSVEPQQGENFLHVPYWALDSTDLLNFLTGQMNESHETAFTDKIFELKAKTRGAEGYPGVDETSITVDTPLPFSLKQLWHDLLDFESKTFVGLNRDTTTLENPGDPNTLTPPVYSPAGMGSAGPFLNQHAFGIRRQLNLLRSRLLDKRFAFLLEPGPWTPDLDGTIDKDLDELLEGWIGGQKPVTVLNLSGIPSGILDQLIGAILKIVYEALFWSRAKTEGGFWRPLLIVMEEAHRYLSELSTGLASETVQRIAKEGRKYGVGAMVVSQRPSEVNETVLSQCGTFITMRLSNPADRARVQGTLPDGVVALLDSLPVLRTGEAIVVGEAARLPMRCRITLPDEEFRPRSGDPEVSKLWSIPRRAEGYDRVVTSWRAQSPYAVTQDLEIDRIEVEDQTNDE